MPRHEHYQHHHHLEHRDTLRLHHNQRVGPSVIRPSRPEDWEPFRDVISNLYSVMKLKDVMKEMQTRHCFKATEKQYKTQIKKWNLDTKYTKASEYMAMIKTRNIRERECPGKQTRFTLRGRTVDPKDIARFEKRAMKKGVVNFEDAPTDEEMVEHLAYDTPSPARSVESFQSQLDTQPSYVNTPTESLSPIRSSILAYSTMEVGDRTPICYAQMPYYPHHSTA